MKPFHCHKNSSEQLKPNLYVGDTTECPSTLKLWLTAEQETKSFHYINIQSVIIINVLEGFFNDRFFFVCHIGLFLVSFNVSCE